MNGQLLEETDSEKDLGVVFSDNLKSAAHCQEAYSKPNRMLGLISRTIKYKNPEVLLNLYKSMVRPHLEYCASSRNIKDNYAARKSSTSLYSVVSSSQKSAI